MSRSATSTRFLNTSRDGDSTTSLGSLFQCLTTLSVQKFFLLSNLTDTTEAYHNMFPRLCSPKHLSSKSKGSHNTDWGLWISFLMRRVRCS